MFDKRNPVARWCWLGRENACHEKWKIRSILCGYKFNSHGTGHHPEQKEWVFVRGDERKVFTPRRNGNLFIFENCHMHGNLYAKYVRHN